MTFSDQEYVYTYIGLLDPYIFIKVWSRKIQIIKTMKAQITLTVPEGKEIIAEAILVLPEVKKALKKGHVLLKGGTTISALSEKLVGKSLWICGRITPKGTKEGIAPAGSSKVTSATHCLLFTNGKAEDVDSVIITEKALRLKKDDVFIISPNAFDAYGWAAMMAGFPFGGPVGGAVTGLGAQGVITIIAAGQEKFIPGTIMEAVKAAGKTAIDISFGLPVGLIPFTGKIISEKEAIEILSEVKATIIGKGGILGAEGSVTLVVEGNRDEVEKIVEIVKSIKGASTKGTVESLSECKGYPECKSRHPVCIYGKSIK